MMNTEQAVDFSVIIPVYNTAPSDLKRCVRNLMKNQNASWEIVFVDDGSTQETLECLNGIKKKLPRVHIYYREHGGAAAARNYGTRQAAGRYITYVDSDDYLLPGALDAMWQILKKEQPDLLVARIVRDHANHEQAMHNATFTVGGEELKNQLRRYYLAFDKGAFRSEKSWVNRAPHARFVKKALAIQKTFPEELLIGEDVIWNFNLLTGAGKVIVSDAPVYHYNFVAGSVTQRFHENLPEKMRMLLSAYREEVRSWPEELQVYYAPAMLEHFSGLMRMYVFAGPPKGRWKRYHEVWNRPEWKNVFRKLRLSFVNRRFLVSGVLGKLHMKRLLYLVCKVHYRR